MGNGKGGIVVNYFDKTVFLKNRELGFSGAVVSLKMAIRMGVFGCFYAFNIFWAAFVGRRCRIFPPWMWHFSVTDAAPKKLNSGIY